MPAWGQRRARDWADVARASFSRAPGGRHPRTTDRLRPLLARWGLLRLIAAFGVLLAVAGLAAGLGYEAADGDGDDRSPLEWWLAGFIGVATGNVPDSGGDGSTGRDVLDGAVAFSGVVVPAIFLGTIVFRLLVVPEVFVFRNRIALAGDPASGRHLAIRLYAGTRLRLLDVRCNVELHVETTAADGSITARYHELEAENESWPLAHRHIPFTVRVPLLHTDVVEEDARPRLVAIRGHTVSDGDFLMVTVTARVPELGTDSTESHVFRVPGEVSARPYASVRTRPGSISDADGWPDFDDAG